MIGYLDPVAPHMPWDGSPTASDRQNTYISFNAWLMHVRAVLSQKNSIEYKEAVLDTASLHCLRGIALEWWMALEDEQQYTLRHDVTLTQWPIIGARLSKRNHAGRKAAMDRKRRQGETLVAYATAKLRMLKEAFPGDREVRDTIKDIRDGLSVQDQLAVREDLNAHPSIPGLIAELQRMDEIKAEEFRNAMGMNNRPSSGVNKQPTPYTKPLGGSNKNQDGNREKKKRAPFVYDSTKIKFRINPKNPSGPKIRTYEYQDGKVIWLERECRHCEGKHFNFECNKKTEGTARAAPMEVEEEEEEDYVDCYVSMSSEPPSGESKGGEYDPEVWDTSEAWDESSYAMNMSEN